MIIPTITLESSLWNKGLSFIAGVDEAGKGPWAGPVTAGAVIVQSAVQIVPSVRDSKYMTARAREKAFPLICSQSSAFGIGIVSSEEIDSLGIEKAVRKAMLAALDAIQEKNNIHISFVLVDGSRTLPLTRYSSQRIKAGGLYHYSIAAGSILAKVTRDRIMKKLAPQFPEYGFEKHVGYGTAYHLNALQRYGICPLHRKSFAPIKKIMKNNTTHL